MPKSFFTDKNNPPDERSLKAALSGLYDFYNELSETTETFKKDWHFYKSSGWVQKIYDSKKSLCHIIPKSGGFNVNFTIREREKEHLEQTERFHFMFEKLKSAKKYPEGYLLQFEVFDPTGAFNCITLIRELTALR